MSPVHKSVRANPLKMMGKGVREKFFFQIAVKIRRFPRTAITDNTAMSVDIVISRWHGIQMAGRVVIAHEVSLIIFSGLSLAKQSIEQAPSLV